VSESGETDVIGNVISLLSNVVKIGVTGGTLNTNFVGGTITIGGVRMTITAVNDTDSSVTVAALADIPMVLVDDDDFNSNDGGALRGDEGEAVAELSDTFSLMQNSDDPTKNVYAPAYIRPEYELSGKETDQVALEEFVAIFGGSAYGDYASFLLAQHYFSKGDYERARMHFERLAGKSDFVFAGKALDYLVKSKRNLNTP